MMPCEKTSVVQVDCSRLWWSCHNFNIWTWVLVKKKYNIIPINRFLCSTFGRGQKKKAATRRWNQHQAGVVFTNLGEVSVNNQCPL